MAFPESQNITYGGEKPEILPQPQQLQPQVESLKDHSISQVKQSNSLLSLTLNEIQLKRGKSIGSMNMDEFFANLWSSDDQNNQVLPHPNNQNEPTKHNDNRTKQVNQGPLMRQGSFSIPTPLCKKTVDEVWFEIQKEGQPQGQKPISIGAAASDHHGNPQPQQTLGEITLEDFLVKAGIVQEGPAGSLQPKIASASASASASAAGSTQNNANQCLDANFGMGLTAGFSGCQNVGTNLVVVASSAGNGFAAYQMFPQSSAKNEKGHGLMAEMAAQQVKKKMLDGPLEMAVERRQRRMIKNRESAARSRARKQAYTVELELELNQLKEENAKLKEILEEIEQKRKEEIVKRKPLMMPPKKADKLRTIRRTTSLAW